MTSKGCASTRRSWGYIVTLVLEMTIGSKAHQGKHCRACTVPPLSSDPKFGPQMALRMSLVPPDPLVAACCGIVPLQAHTLCGWLQDHGGLWTLHILASDIGLAILLTLGWSRDLSSSV